MTYFQKENKKKNERREISGKGTHCSVADSVKYLARHSTYTTAKERDRSHLSVH
jgi:hypothetical protein